MFSIFSGSTVLKYSLAKSSLFRPDLKIKNWKSFRTGQLIRDLFHARCKSVSLWDLIQINTVSLKKHAQV